MLKAIKQMLTEDEGDSVYDPLRIAFLFTVTLMIVGLGEMISLTVLEVIFRGKPFAADAFGTAVAALGAGIGALILSTGVGLYAGSHQKGER